MTPQQKERKLATWLFNPFVYITGWEAMFNGILIIAVTGYIGSRSNTHFDGVLDTHTGMPGPLWGFLAEGLIAWLCMAIVLWAFGKCISKTAFRTIDLFGTQAVARCPMLITSLACLLPPYTRFTEYIIQAFAGTAGEVPFQITDAVVFGTVVTAMVIILCWAVYLMYRSYSVSCNISGGKAIGTFIAGIILSEILSKALIISMFIWIQQDRCWKVRVGEGPQQSDPAAITFQHQKIYTFDEDEGVERINGDKGLSVDIESGEARIHGTTTDAEWGPESVKVVVIDNGSAVDVSGKFRIEERQASGLVFLEAETQNGGPLIHMFQWSPLFNVIPALEAYQIQMRWFRIPAELVNGVGSIRVPGDPEKAFCSLRIHIREDHETVDFFANGVFQGTVVFEESFGPIVSAKMELQTPRKGHRFDVRFDDLTIRWNNSPL